MALRYRYDKEGKVTGMGWGKGKNYEAGQKKLKTDPEKEKKRKKNVKTTKINKEIDRIKSGGKTYFKSKEDSLTSLKKKLEIAGGSSKKKSNKGKIRRAGGMKSNEEIFGKEKLAKIKEKHKQFKDNRTAMAELRKKDPAAYRKKKAEQRRKAMKKAHGSKINRSSSWD
tara:strand:+ start:45 stop:551 length:507 start_codon:yes stop_codon:yes gene_type:complete